MQGVVWYSQQVCAVPPGSVELMATVGSGLRVAEGFVIVLVPCFKKPCLGPVKSNVHMIIDVQMLCAHLNFQALRVGWATGRVNLAPYRTLSQLMFINNLA